MDKCKTGLKAAGTEVILNWCVWQQTFFLDKWEKAYEISSVVTTIKHLI